MVSDDDLGISVNFPTLAWRFIGSDPTNGVMVIFSCSRASEYPHTIATPTAGGMNVNAMRVINRTEIRSRFAVGRCRTRQYCLASLAGV